MKRLLFIFSFFFLFVLNGKTQEVEILTLEDCLRIGIDNNLSLEGKRKEIQRSKYGVSENRSKLLPQINAIAGYSNNFDPPVSVTDGSSYGVPYNIFQKWYKDTRKKVVEVQVDGAPAIGHEEKSRASDQPQPVSPGRNDHPVRIWVEIRISNAMACICSKRI